MTLDEVFRAIEQEGGPAIISRALQHDRQVNCSTVIVETYRGIVLHEQLRHPAGIDLESSIYLVMCQSPATQLCHAESRVPESAELFAQHIFRVAVDIFIGAVVQAKEETVPGGETILRGQRNGTIEKGPGPTRLREIEVELREKAVVDGAVRIDVNHRVKMLHRSVEPAVDLPLDRRDCVPRSGMPDRQGKPGHAACAANASAIACGLDRECRGS